MSARSLLDFVSGLFVRVVCAWPGCVNRVRRRHHHRYIYIYVLMFVQINV